MKQSEIPQAAPRRRNTNPNPNMMGEDVVVQIQVDETAYEGFMRIHTQAYAATKEGTILDEEGFKDKAFNSYQTALELIDKALQISYGGGFSTEEVNKVDEIVYKMRMTRKEILERVSDLQHSTESRSYLEGPSAPTSLNLAGPNFSLINRRPPAYTVGNFDGVTTPPASLPGGSIPQSPTAGVPVNGAAGSAPGSLYGNLSSVLDDIASSQSVMPNPLPINAHEILFIENEVQIYFISPDGNVSAPSYPSFLRIVVSDEEPENVQPGTVTSMANFPAFIQCGDWIYPLVKNQSPVYKSPDGTYLFPDLTSPVPGASVGLILPSSYSEESRAAFEDSVLQLVGLQVFPGTVAAEAAEPQVPAEPTPKAPPRKISSMIAEGLIQGAETVSKGIQMGAQKTSTYLDKGTTYLVTKIDPAKSMPEISPAMRSRMKTAKNVTGKAVQVSGYLVTQLSRGTMKLGQYLAPHIHSKATQLYASATKIPEEKASEQVNQVLDVASGAFTGFTIVYSGLEDAAKVLANSLASNTVHVVSHRYGTEAGGLAGDATATVGNCVVTGYNARMFGPKAVVKRAAKDAGKAALVKVPHTPKGGPHMSKGDPHTTKEGPHTSKGGPSGSSPPK